LMFTLSSLLGSYFYLQLSQWARDAPVLKAKSDFNRTASTDEQKKAMREVRIELKRITAWPNYVVNTLVILFVLGACGNALAMLCYVRTDPIYPYVMGIIIVFIVLFVILSVVLLATGGQAGRAIANEIARLEGEGKL
jgi:protein-S-isoprenylcysteine O-methyltransferase Ste14